MDDSESLTHNVLTARCSLPPIAGSIGTNSDPTIAKHAPATTAKNAELRLKVAKLQFVVPVKALARLHRGCCFTIEQSSVNSSDAGITKRGGNFAKPRRIKHDVGIRESNDVRRDVANGDVLSPVFPSPGLSKSFTLVESKDRTI